jgi:hypothetical protein
MTSKSRSPVWGQVPAVLFAACTKDVDRPCSACIHSTCMMSAYSCRVWPVPYLCLYARLLRSCRGLRLAGADAARQGHLREGGILHERSYIRAVFNSGAYGNGSSVMESCMQWLCRLHLRHGCQGSPCTTGQVLGKV